MRTVSIFLCFLGIAIAGCTSSVVSDKSSSSKEYIELTDNKYNAVSLNNQVSSIQKAMLALVDSVFRSRKEAVSKNVENAIFELDISIQRLRYLGEEDEIAKYFSNSVIELMQFYKSEFENNFQALIPVLEKEELSDSDQSLLNDYDRLFVNTEATFFNEIMVRQDSFAQYFNIGLRE